MALVSAIMKGKLFFERNFDMIYGGILEGENEKGYTYLLEIFKIMNHFQKNYNWLISDCEIGATKKGRYERLFQSGNHAWITGTELTGNLKKKIFNGYGECYQAFRNNILMKMF